MASTFMDLRVIDFVLPGVHYRNDIAHMAPMCHLNIKKNYTTTTETRFGQQNLFQYPTAWWQLIHLWSI